MVSKLRIRDVAVLAYKDDEAQAAVEIEEMMAAGAAITLQAAYRGYADRRDRRPHASTAVR